MVRSSLARPDGACALLLRNELHIFVIPSLTSDSKRDNQSHSRRWHSPRYIQTEPRSNKDAPQKPKMAGDGSRGLFLQDVPAR